MRSRFVYLSLLCLPLVFAISPASAKAQPSTAELVDVAGRQRMLSQRIVKAYVQVAQEVLPDVAEKQLHDSIEIFERQLTEIKRAAPGQEVQASLKSVEYLWKPFRTLASGPVTREGAKELMETSEALLQACQKVVTQLEALSGLPQARLVNISGRQRMLSQRIAKAYMFLSWGLGTARVESQLEQSRDEFEGAMRELRRAPRNSLSITRALDEVERQWNVFRGSFMLSESGTYVPLHVAMSSEKILALFNDITQMYASEAAGLR